MRSSSLAELPAVHSVLDEPALADLAVRVGRSVVVAAIRKCLNDARDELRRAESLGAEAIARIPKALDIAQAAAANIAAAERGSLRPVINATGILLHTGLGRAPLAEEAVAAMNDVARDYASVEVDLESGERSQRIAAVEELLCELTGAEAAVVANNNAGATMLTLAATAAGREVIVSRGELIEIGGSFRLPDVMQASGAILREVGTTNKTRIGDYRAALSPQTGALMRAHPSNFVVMGFTESASLEQLVSLGREYDLPVIDDIGSGALIDFAPFGFSGEPVAGRSIAAGADLVLFSGDKLLGGPQCGVVVGRKEHVGRLARHPMMRAMRVDKLTLAALAATLRLYRDPALAVARVPLLAMLSTPVSQLAARAQRMASELGAMAAVAASEPMESEGFLGGGSVPTQRLATWCVGLRPARCGLAELSRTLRLGSPGVVGRVHNDRLLLDLRTVPPRQDEALLTAVRDALAGGGI